jgi:hypothetical protein
MMKKLELPLHPNLETIFGYPGSAPKVVFYWEPQSDKLMYDDGQGSGTANSWAYLIWAGHPSVQAHLPKSEQAMLLLERSERKLYSVNRQEAVAALQSAQAEATLLQPEKVSLQPWKEAQQLMADFVGWLGSGTAKKAA